MTEKKDTIPMARTQLLFLAAAAGAALAAPAAATRHPPHSSPERGLESVNQPVVQRTDYVLDVAAPTGTLSTVERGRLRGWFDSLALGYGDRVFVDEPYGPGPGTADIARVAAEYGLLLTPGAPVTAGSVQPGSVRVIVSRSTAFVPNCPHSEDYRGPSSVSVNYGCSVNGNLAAMIADPADLVRGQTGSIGADTVAGSKAIKLYRDTPPSGTKGLQSTVTRGGSNQ